MGSGGEEGEGEVEMEGKNLIGHLTGGVQEVLVQLCV